MYCLRPELVDWALRKLGEVLELPSARCCCQSQFRCRVCRCWCERLDRGPAALLPIEGERQVELRADRQLTGPEFVPALLRMRADRSCRQTAGTLLARKSRH